MGADKGIVVKWKWITLLLLVSIFLTNGYWIWRWRERLRVVRVIDGDTLVIKAGDRVRLAGLDAPEIGKCGSKEATRILSSFISGKIIKIDSEDRDNWGRRLGIIYTEGINVNLELVKSGWARADSFEGKTIPELIEAGKTAEEKSLGIFGAACNNQQTCSILGNIDQSTGKKYYHLPECSSYSKVKIDIKRGERVFCSEDQAKKAGFLLVPDCVR